MTTDHPSLDTLLERNRSWAELMTSSDPDFFARLARQQAPRYLWIGCADSRVPANQIVGLMPGEVFVHRNIANMVVHTDLNCLSVMQFAVDILKIKHIIVLSDDTFDPDHADDRTLVTLLHLRDIEVQLGDPYSIITEMNDDGNREVAQVTKADDFIVSNKLISLLLTQLAENKHLQRVFAELFDPAGSEIYLKPAALYVRPGEPVNFATVIEAAKRRGETAIGIRTRDGGDDGPAYGVTLNPPKSAPLTLAAHDSVVIVAAN